MSARATDATVRPVPLTGPQLRVLHELLSVVRNDPYWGETTATSARDMATLGRAHDVILSELREAQRAASTPAGRLP